MMTITNNRIASLEPDWAPFSGFSILFDNPGDSYVQRGRFSKICCDSLAGGPLDFYARLTATLNVVATKDFIRTCNFCPLPPYAYHVTAWDGINDDNIGSVTPDAQSDWASFLGNLPGALKTPPESMTVVAGSAFGGWSKCVSFGFKRLVLWSNQVLAAELAPADKASEKLLNEFIESRKVLNDEAGKIWGIRSADTYAPHVSLGYFANEQGAGIAKSQVPEWSTFFRAKTRGSSITFDSVDIYGFTDMTTFLKLS